MPHASTMDVTDVKEEYVTPENINPEQTKELVRFPSYENEVYLNPQHPMDQISPGVFNNITQGQTREFVRFDSDEPDVYLTPQHLIDQMSPDVFSANNHETQNTRENIFGHRVPIRQKEHTYVQDEEDEYGYSLANTNVIDTPHIRFPSSPINSAKQKRSNRATFCQRLKKHRFTISLIVIGFLWSVSVSLIIAYVIYANTNQSSINDLGNFMVRVYGLFVCLNLVFKL